MTSDIFSFSGPDGWRHLLRADWLGDPKTICGQDYNHKGPWAMHKAEPSCPECRAKGTISDGQSRRLENATHPQPADDPIGAECRPRSSGPAGIGEVG